MSGDVVRLAFSDGVAVITIDNPPVNSLSRQVRYALKSAFETAHGNAGLKAIVLTGANGRFSAGADIKEFADPGEATDLHLGQLINLIEASEKPVIAAIEGLAMGGGLELTLGCHYRVATNQAQIALPEINLGLVPGAGGTQRLPRAIGLQSALEIITTGRPVRAHDRKVAPLFDKLVDTDAVSAALALAREVVGRPVRPLRGRAVPDAHPATIVETFRAGIKKRERNPAFAAAIACIEASLQEFPPGEEFERSQFTRLLATPESKAFIHAFFAERDVWKVPDIPAATATKDVRHIGVVGAGTMGRGIAIAFLDAGFTVSVFDSKQEAIDRARAEIEKTYDAATAKRRLTDTAAQERLRRLSLSEDLGALAACDLVIEAVFEDFAIKREALAQIEAVVSQSAVIASNTSTLDVNALAESMTASDRFLGMHFFSPANIMRLVEIVRGRATAKETVATAQKVTRALGKIGVISGVCDGFIGNRMLEEYLRQAYFLLDEGALPQDVDRALEDWGMAMGPFRMSDMAGNDIGWAIRKRRKQEQPDRPYSALPDLLCEKGRFGQKSGAGYYRYESGSRTAIPDSEVQTLIERYGEEHGIRRREIEASEIVERCIYALVNEGARILEDGIALRSGDIDVVYLNGYGFPRDRGGPMHYANHIGLSNLVAAMQRFQRSYRGEFWQPAPFLLQLSERNAQFR